jgi:hypothetical protein
MAPGARPVASTAITLLAPPPGGPFALQAAHHLSQRLPDDTLLQAQHEPKQGAVIRHRGKLERAAQLLMLGQTNLRRAKSPILVAHQTQNGQQLRLRETLRRKSVTVRRQHLPRDLQRDTSKRHQSNFTHALPIYTRRLRVQEAFQQSQPILKAYIHEAIEAEKAGLKVTLKKNPEPIPEELKNKLDEIPAFKTAFEALTPGRQRGYILYFSGAKQSKTRTSRIEKCMPQILNGKGLNDY